MKMEGRIEPWQPRKRQRRKRSTKRSISKQQTGDAEASPKFFWRNIFLSKKPSHARHPERSLFIRSRMDRSRATLTDGTILGLFRFGTTHRPCSSVEVLRPLREAKQPVRSG